MGGTKLGGQKAANTNRKRHGNDFYKRIGSMGGKIGGGKGGFHADHELARRAAKIGGSVSRRRPRSS